MHDFCLTIPYGMLMVFGGIVGFIAAGSKASLIAGVCSGGLLTLFGYGGVTNYTYSHCPSLCMLPFSVSYSLAVISSTIGVMMVMRVNKTGKFMPSGLIAGLSVGMSLFYCFKLAKTSSKAAPKKA
ncbi:unnamed protein product [Choristocarpus tenellus]